MSYMNCIEAINQEKYYAATNILCEALRCNIAISDEQIVDILNRIVDYYNFNNIIFDMDTYESIHTILTSISFIEKLYEQYPNAFEIVRHECVRYLICAFKSYDRNDDTVMKHRLFVQQSMNNFRRIMKRFCNNEFTREELISVLNSVECAFDNEISGHFSMYNSFILFYDYTLIIDDVILFVERVGKKMMISSSKIILNDIHHNLFVSEHNKDCVYDALNRSIKYRKLTVMRG